jgi:VanZ family protein
MDQPSFLDRVSRYLPLILWLAFIFFASSNGFSASNTSPIIGPLVLWLFPNTSPETLVTIHFFTRKLAHFTEYAILGFLAVRAFSNSHKPFLRRHWFVITLILVVIYALSDEYHQSFVPSRTASIFDSLIDVAGGLTALTVSYFWKRRSQPNQNR